MKNQNLHANVVALTPLSHDEMLSINGGESFFYWVGYIVGATLKTIYETGKAAGEYQASLPPVHKK